MLVLYSSVFFLVFLMIRRPPRSTLTHSFPTRRSSDLLINGREAGAARAAEMLDGPFGAARFLFELLADRGIGIERGSWISSGEVTGVHPVAVGGSIEARFDGDRIVRCPIPAAMCGQDQNTEKKRKKRKKKHKKNKKKKKKKSIKGKKET